jgi:hypothetical protein
MKNTKEHGFMIQTGSGFLQSGCTSIGYFSSMLGAKIYKTRKSAELIVTRWSECWDKKDAKTAEVHEVELTVMPF